MTLFLDEAMMAAMDAEAKAPAKPATSLAFEVNAWFKARTRESPAHKAMLDLPDEQKAAVQQELRRRKLWGRSASMADRLQAEAAGSPCVVMITTTYGKRPPPASKVAAHHNLVMRELRKNAFYGARARARRAGGDLTKDEAPMLRAFAAVEHGDLHGRVHFHQWVFCSDDAMADLPGASDTARLDWFVMRLDRHGEHVPVLDKDGKPRTRSRGRPVEKRIWPKGFIKVALIKGGTNVLSPAEFQKKMEYGAGYLMKQNARKLCSLSPPIGYVLPLEGAVAPSGPYHKKWLASQVAKHGPLAASPVVKPVAARQRAAGKRLDFAHKRDAERVGCIVTGSGPSMHIRRGFHLVGSAETSFAADWLRAGREGMASASTVSDAIRRNTFDRRRKERAVKPAVQLVLPDLLAPLPPKPEPWDTPARWRASQAWWRARRAARLIEYRQEQSRAGIAGGATSPPPNIAGASP